MEAALRVPSTTMGHESENSGGFPEIRLWAAIILNTLHEYEGLLTTIQTSWQIRKRPVNRLHLHGLNNIRRECADPWFRHVCDMAGTVASKVIAQLNKLDERYFLKDYEFTPRASIVSIYSLSRHKRRT